jgi:2-(1,2-epoxy-1,2-dihydrophenyl)acetyl-CoA isomerase
VTDLLSVERAAGVATVTLNRPDTLNALNNELKDGLLAAIGDLGADCAVRAVVLTGAGRGFCVGQDLAEHLATIESGDASLFTTVTQQFNPITLGLATMPKPVIAAVNGPAAGAGAGLAFACDFRIVSSKAYFLLAFAKIGLTLDSGTSWTLQRLVGGARATALSILAEPIHAEAALEMGLVNAVVEAEHVLSAAQELATRLANGPTAAYGAIKESIAYAATSTLADALAKEAELQSAMGDTADHINATAAFIAKQPTTFVGH